MPSATDVCQYFISSLRASWSSSSSCVSILRYGRWVSTSLHAIHNITEALPQVKRLEARQRRQGPRQRLAAIRPQLIVPAQEQGILRHQALHSHLGPLGPQSLGRVLGAWRLSLSSSCSLAWISSTAGPAPLAPGGSGAAFSNRARGFSRCIGRMGPFIKMRGGVEAARRIDLEPQCSKDSMRFNTQAGG